MGTNLYRVTLCATSMPWPLSFAEHLWFVTEHGGVATRIEVWAPLWVKGETTVLENALPPFEGFRTSFLHSIKNPRRRSQVRRLAVYEGGQGSVAAQLSRVLRTAKTRYPYRYRYRLWPGPNSNTFVAWVLAQVPEVNVTLPRQAVGKSYPLPPTV